jgi:hypothetical protein
VGQNFFKIKKHILDKSWEMLVIKQVCDHIFYNINEEYDKSKIMYGQYESHWLVFCAYIMQVLRVELPKEIITLMLLAQEVNCWFSTKEVVYVTRKPKECVL